VRNGVGAGDLDQGLLGVAADKRFFALVRGELRSPAEAHTACLRARPPFARSRPDHLSLELGPGKTVATIIVDSGLRYVSTDVFRVSR